jgi:hypothetical protein
MPQLDPLTGQTVPQSPEPTDAPIDPLDPAALRVLDRRRGPRRADEPEAEIPTDRRSYADRRKRTPGLPALLGAILSDEEPEPET